MDEIKEIETVLGLRKHEVVCGGKTVELHEFTIKDLPRILRLVDQARESGSRLEEIFQDGKAMKFERFDWIQALLRSGEPALHLINLSARRHQLDWLEEISASYLMDLLAGLIEVNADFFGRIPAIRDHAEKLSRVFSSMRETSEPAAEPAVAESGDGSSTSSSEPVIN